MNASAAAGEAAIDISSVVKVYPGGVRALDAGAMRVMRGEIFGLLGANGAGKSTLVKILMTVVRPTRLEGAMLGAPVGRRETLTRVGYLPEHHSFPGHLTGAQVIDFYAAMAGAPRRQRRARAGELLELVGMTDWARKRVRSYSKGMRQRIGLAQALAHDPELMLLDEPTDGVDPVGRRDIRNILLRLRAEGRTIFLNSHMLSELELVCDRVAILARGQVVRQGTLEELTREGRRYEIEVAAATPQEGEAAIKAAIGPLASPNWEQYGPPRGWEGAGQLRSGEPCRVEGAMLQVGADDAQAVQPLIDALRSRGITIRSVRPHRPSLEDMFMQSVVDPQTGAERAPGAEIRRGRSRRRKGRQ